MLSVRVWLLVLAPHSEEVALWVTSLNPSSCKFSHILFKGSSSVIPMSDSFATLSWFHLEKWLHFYPTRKVLLVMLRDSLILLLALPLDITISWNMSVRSLLREVIKLMCFDSLLLPQIILMRLVSLFNIGPRRFILLSGWVRRLFLNHFDFLIRKFSDIHCLWWVQTSFLSLLYSSDILVFFVNLLGVRVFGELEFWFSSIKSTYW